MIFPQYGLYAITRTHQEFGTQEQLLTEIEAALKGGATVVQYRDKNSPNALCFSKALLNLCHNYHVPLVINDDIKLAKQINADGVHLGRDDGDIIQARAYLGDNKIIGVSCYNDVNKAILAQTQSANYVAFGRFFSSNTKPLAQAADINTLIQAKKVLTVPIVAIGGILPSNGEVLLKAGADILAVIGGLFESDTEKAALAYCALFKR